jgi:aminoacrylate hydrolase
VNAEGPAGRISWRRLGDGPSLLMLNGYAASSGDWDPDFLGSLARSFTLICPDNRGIGGSDGTPDEITIDAMADDAVALLEHLGIGSCTVLGWSMGGFVAQTLASKLPQTVESLILLSTDPGGDMAVRRDQQTEQLLTDHTGSPREQARRLLGLLFPPGLSDRLFEQFGDVVAEARASLRPEILSAQERAMDQWYEQPCRSRLEAIAAATIVARGDLDVVIPPQNSERIAAAIPGSQLEVFAGGGHAFMAQFPEQAARLVAGSRRR